MDPSYLAWLVEKKEREKTGSNSQPPSQCVGLVYPVGRKKGADQSI